MFQLVRKQVYKLELPARWKIHDIFHISLLEQNIAKKGREFSVLEFEPGNNKEYKLEAIQERIVYAKKADGHLSKLYYLVV